MKKESPNPKKNLSRAEMERLHRSGDYRNADTTAYDRFSEQALRGLQYQESDLGQTLSGLEQRLKLKAAPPRRRPLGQRLLFAASISLLMGVAVWALFHTSPEAQLFAQHFDLPPCAMEAAERSKSREPATSASPLSLAIQAYENEAYKAAESGFRIYLEKSPEDGEAQFYYALLLLKRGASDAALPILAQLAEKAPKPSYQRPVQWYLGLALLHNGQSAEAAAQFSGLTDGGDRYARQAKQALQSLRMP